MTCATVTFSQPALFDASLLTGRACRRVLRGCAVIALASIGAAGVVGLVTVAAGWMVTASLSGNRYLHPTPVLRPETLALNYRYPVLAGPADRAVAGPRPVARVVLPDFAFGAAFAVPALTKPAPLGWLPEPRDGVAAPRLASRPAQMRATPRRVEAAESTVDPAPTGTIRAPAASAPPAAVVPPRSLDTAQNAGPGPKLAALPPPSTEPEKPASVLRSYTDLHSLPGPRSRVAVYDIAAHTVYLPSGERLEAHSGVGRRLDDPRYVREKNRGPTPPNVYDLKLRGELFHGVRAIRLNPVDESGMFGRDGILAHTYMLGPSGQSFGCVSFKNYPAFLRAYLNGEVDRIVVVPHLERSAVHPTASREERRERDRSDG